MIEIHISGTYGAGKSTLLRYIKECLEKANLTVDVNTDDPQFQEDQNLLFQRPDDLQNVCLQSIKGIIKISQHQVNRLSFKDVKEIGG